MARLTNILWKLYRRLLRCWFNLVNYHTPMTNWEFSSNPCLHCLGQALEHSWSIPHTAAFCVQEYRQAIDAETRRKRAKENKHGPTD